MKNRPRGRNPVARHASKFNRGQTHVDRKQAQKRGERRHKKKWVDTQAA